MVKKLFVITILTCLIHIMMPKSITAGNYFVDCDVALENKDYIPLRDYYNSIEDDLTPEMCFRLNKREYLVTVNRTASISSGIYYYNSTDNTFMLYADNSTTCFPGVTIVEEFMGKNNKRYVLMVGGITGSVFYKIFNLVEIKDEGSYPFITYDIIYDRWNPVDGLCRDYDQEPIASEILNHKILNQGTEKVEIIFNILEQDCRTKVKRTYKKIFHLKDGIFTADQ